MHLSPFMELLSDFFSTISVKINFTAEKSHTMNFLYCLKKLRFNEINEIKLLCGVFPAIPAKITTVVPKLHVLLFFWLKNEQNF